MKEGKNEVKLYNIYIYIYIYIIVIIVPCQRGPLRTAGSRTATGPHLARARPRPADGGQPRQGHGPGAPGKDQVH